MITVFTEVHNNYGHFIPQWIEWLKKQTVVPNILIVLGSNHGADIDYLKSNNIKYIYYDSTNMGKLRNVALERIKTDWKLYFSVDDELLPNACEEILKSTSDAVSLKFNVHNIDGSILVNCESPAINTIDDIINWRQFRWGGYVAFKNKDIRFNEEIEIPNILLHFELFKRNQKTIKSSEALAICHRWEKSHGLSILTKGMIQNNSEYIENEVSKLL